LLKIAPKDAVSSQGFIVHSSLFIEKRIIDVKMGDYTLSLNEETGQLEPRKIKGLLDMGVKPVFKLTTEDGRTIRTTSNHPYLVKGAINHEQRREVSLRRLESLAREHGLRGESLSEDAEFSSPRAVWLNPTTSPSGCLNMLEHIRGSRQMAQDRIHSIPVYIKGLALRDSNLPKVSSEAEVSQGIGSKGIAQPDSSNTSSIKWIDQITQAKWLKVMYLNVGDEIAVYHEPRTMNNEPYVLWAKISSIEYVGYEQVYDIEVEGTHNFVANDIIAHNTYMSGNVGIAPTPIEAGLCFMYIS
jgi:hypothetical protein